MIRNNGGWDSFKMLEIKKFPCNDKREALAEEDKVMKELSSNVNLLSTESKVVEETEEEIAE